MSELLIAFLLALTLGHMSVNRVSFSCTSDRNGFLLCTTTLFADK